MYLDNYFHSHKFFLIYNLDLDSRPEFKNIQDISLSDETTKYAGSSEKCVRIFNFFYLLCDVCLHCEIISVAEPAEKGNLRSNILLQKLISEVICFTLGVQIIVLNVFFTAYYMRKIIKI